MIGYPNITKLTGISDPDILLDFADIEEALRLGIAKPVKTIPGKGLLAAIEDEVVYILCALDKESSAQLMKELPKDRTVVLCIHGEEAIELAKEELGAAYEDTYYQYVYTGSSEDISKHMKCADGYDLEIFHPGDEYFDTVKEYYDLVPEEDLRRDFHDPSFLGGLADGEFACFIGLHGEGAMGLLRVFPKFRRRGFAEKIYSTLIFNQLKRGAIPYCHVDITNDASIHLQNKLGFVRAGMKVAWMVRRA